MKADTIFLKNLYDAGSGGSGLAPDASYWRRRIASELLFAAKFSDELCAGQYDESVSLAVEKLKLFYREDGAVTKAHVLAVEETLAGLSKAAKEYTVICAAHAHIDMNWMWGWAETAAVSLDTFRTMLNLMDEYENFTFSQSQASIYALTEKYDPAMFEEIKRRVAEKRWEVTASEWVEADKNMPGGESLVRHILYTKNYFRDKFGIQPDELALSFNPDTFGHNVNLAEALAAGGVKYYYHCRGRDEYFLYRYKAPSGAEVLTYREPEWYNAAIDPDMTLKKVDYYRETGTKTALKVYGVGDHGGGPTRRDIERIIDMGTWPLAPVIKFGTYAEFFRAAEACRDSLPVVDTELNFIFDACYTTQTRIKAANRVAENRLFQAELLNAQAALTGAASYGQDYFEPGWINTLFNHFHDILPGSGKIDTREDAMGLFQDTLSRTNTAMGNAMRAISARIGASGLLGSNDMSGTRSEGAGAGMSVTDFVMPAAERGRGLGRIYHIFNNSPIGSKCGGKRLAKVAVWDWPGNKDNLRVADADGAELRFQFAETDQPNFWEHTHFDLCVEVDVEPYGYATIVVTEKQPGFVRTRSDWDVIYDVRTIHAQPYRLENGLAAVEFDPLSMDIVSYADKRTGKTTFRNAGFRYVREDPAGNAWTVGKYMSLGQMENVRIKNSDVGEGKLRQWISYSCTMGGSKADITVSLDDNSAEVSYEVKADWTEIGRDTTFIPQLQFLAELGYDTDEFLYDAPFGVVKRGGLDHDVPGLSFACAKNPAGNSAVIFTKTKYGYRAGCGKLALTLIRSSFGPDPYPEIGLNCFEFAVGAEDASENIGLLKRSAGYNNPLLSISGTAHDGDKPAAGSLLSLEGNVILSGVKLAEGGAKDKVVARVYEPDGKGADVRLSFGRQVKAARLVDALERPVDGDVKVSGDMVEFAVKAYKTAAVIVEM